jgi:diketogulonate reductase-like aldo/keto reductase
MTQPAPLTLNNGVFIPPIALGLWQVWDEQECIDAVNAALEAGYRHFDSAQFYQNEGYLCEAIRDRGFPREDLFLTTKISNDNQLAQQVAPSFDRSIRNLGYDYWDLLLLHFPVSDVRQANWKVLEEIYDSGRAKAIGVSNYTVRHLEELLADCRVKPAVNQVELHVYLQQPELLEFCVQHDILVEAYSPMAEGRKLNHPVLQELGRKHHKTPAQIMIRWCLDIGTVPLPKSVHADRIQENFDVFDFMLDSDDLAKIASLNLSHRFNWDPTHVD